jgi:hypothetical protein
MTLDLDAHAASATAAAERLQRKHVATMATAIVLRRTRHPAAAAHLEAAAADLAAEIEAVLVGGKPRPRACLLCGCTDERGCADGCLWVSAPTGIELCTRCAAVADLARAPTAQRVRLRAVLDPHATTP